MSAIDTIKNQIPEYAKDLKLNLSSMFNPENLSEEQIYGIALACAATARNDDLLQAIYTDALDVLSETHLNAALTATSIMGMNNVYYRFLHLVSDKEYEKMPAKLRMNGIMNHGIEKVDFELYALAVSSINGCGMCMDSHAAVLINHGVSKPQIQDAIRIAAIIKGVADALYTNHIITKAEKENAA